jgi:hypothetical protein
LSTELVERLAKILLPGRAGCGIMAMLEALEFYYDDSGAHAGSDVIVWGGVAGHVEYINEMQVAWDERLNAPCENRPPIKKFSSYDLQHGDGEFEGYRQGEKDLTRKNFRDVITNAGLTVLSYGVSATDWNELLDGVARIALRSPEHTILALAIQGGCEMAIKEDLPVAFVFDKGADARVDFATAFRNGVEASKLDPDKASYGVSPVLGNAGLQAADLVAHETYQLFREYRLSGNASPAAHLDRLRQDAHDFNARWIGRKEIEDMMERIRDAFEQGKWPPSKS